MISQMKNTASHGCINPMRIPTPALAFLIAPLAMAEPVAIFDGKQVLDYTTDADPVPGPVGLQVHGGLEMRIDFRNHMLTELEAGPP